MVNLFSIGVSVQFNGGNNSLFNKWYWDNWIFVRQLDLHMQRNRAGQNPTSYHNHKLGQISS